MKSRALLGMALTVMLMACESPLAPPSPRRQARVRGTYTCRVCNAGPGVCSEPLSVSL